MQPVERARTSPKLLAETVAKLQSQVLMLLPGLETGLKIQAVLHLGNGGKKKKPWKIFFRIFLIQLSMEPMAGGQAQEWP